MADQSLPGWAGLDSAIDQLRKLPPDRQALVLQGIDPAKKRAIQFRLNDLAATKKEKSQPRESIQSFVQGTAQSEAQKAQQAQGRAEEPTVYQGGKVVGQRPLLIRAGNALLSLGHESANIINQMYAGALDPKTAIAMIVGRLSPAAAGAFFATGGVKSLYEAIQKGTAGPDDVQKILLALAQVAGSTGGAAEGAPAEAARINAATSAVKNAPELVRQGSQILAGVGPERTTAPLVEEFEKAKKTAGEKQAGETEKTDVANREKAEKYQTQKREAFQKEEEARAEHAFEVEQVKARNQAQQELHTNRGNLARNINQGSADLGTGIEALDKKVRAQGNEKYNAVRAKVSADEGVEIEPVADAVRHAEQKIIKGSPESVRQFHSIQSKEAMGQVEGEGAEGGGAVPPDIWESLTAEQQAGTKLKFDQLQGYSSEIGTRLAKGGLQDDVYRALKYVKEAIDKQKEVIAGRNGAASELKAADSFWRQYMETFYDKPSAVAATLARVGKLDPEYYAEPFFGKAAKTSINKLRSYDPDLASKAENLRQQQEEFKKTGGAAALRKGPKVEAEPEAPAPGQPPKKPEFESPKTVEQPAVPTEADVIARKKSEIQKEARNLGSLSRFDVGLLASSAIAPIISSVMGRGWETMVAEGAAGPAIVAGRRAFSQVLQKPKVMEWLAKPTEEDLRILSKVNPDVQAKVKAKIRDFIRNEEAHGSEVKLAPTVRNWLRISGTKLVKRGQEILEGDRGEAGMPGSVVEGGDLDQRLSHVNAGIDAKGDSAAVDRARQELGPDAKLSAVMRRAQEIKAEKGATQGTSEQRPGKPALSESAEMRERRGEAALTPRDNVPALRRQLQSLKARIEHAKTTGERMKMVEELRLVEDKLLAAEGKPLGEVGERSEEEIERKKTRKMGQPRSE